MEFRFSEEEEDLRSAVREFVEKEIVEKEVDKTNGLPMQVVRKMGELGFLSLKVSREYGGEPASWVDIGILVEEIARGDINLAYFTTLSYLVSLLLANCGQKELAGEWVPGLTNGTKLGSIAMTEAQGCGPAAMRTTAVTDGHSYIISGKTCPVSFGMHAEFTIVLAPFLSEAGTDTMTAFFVPIKLLNVAKNPDIYSGLLSSIPASLIFDNVRIPIDYRLGKEGEGLALNRKYGLRSDLNQVLCALASLGLCQSALKLAVSYSRERKAFGRSIGQFQAISGRIAEDATLIEAGRWMCYRALWLKDQDLPNAKEAAMCGSWCPGNAYRITEDALLIHGHSGYSDDHPLQQMLKDVLAFEMIAGTRQALHMVIAENVIGKTSVPKEMAGVFGEHVETRDNQTVEG